MRRIIAGTLALLVLSSPCLLGAEGATKTKAKAKPKVVKKAAPPPVSAQLQQMKDQLNQQQQQINQLQQQLQQSNQQLQSAQQQLQSGVQQAAQQAQAAQRAASSAQQTANSLNSSVTDLKTTTATVSQGLATTQKDVKELMNPLAIRYKGTNIQPIGYLEGAAFWRSRSVVTSGSDTATTYNTIPLNGTPLAAMHEFRFTSRNTTLGFVASGNAGTTKVNGYFQIDFDGGNFVAQKYTTSNNWAPRLRWAAAEVQTASGWRVLGGQYNVNSMLNRKLIEPLTEWGPVGDDNSSFTGVGTFRQPMIRVTKNFHNNKAAIAISIDQSDFGYTNDAATSQLLAGIPAATLTSPTVLNPNSSTAGAAATVANPTLPVTPTCTVTNTGATAGAGATPLGTLACVNNLAGITSSIPIAPDIWVKMAFDPKPGWHVEIKGVARFFRDRLLTPVNTPSGTTAPALTDAGTNNVTEGGGAGLGVIIPVTKKAEFLFNSLAGRGISRYLSAGGVGNMPDVTLSGIGCGTTLNAVPQTAGCSNKLVALRAAGVSTGFELHPTPKFDFNVYYGLEYYGRYNNSPTYFGNGFGDARTSPSSASGTTANGGDNKTIQQFMVTPVYRFYRGPYGTFQAMLSGQYALRTTWVQGLSATGACTASASSPWTLNGNNCTGKANEFVGIFGLRYILP